MPVAALERPFRKQRTVNPLIIPALNIYFYPSQHGLAGTKRLGRKWGGLLMPALGD